MSTTSLIDDLPFPPDDQLRRFLEEFEATNGRMYQDRRRESLTAPLMSNVRPPLRPRYYGRNSSNNVRLARAHSGLSQAELAAKVGTTKRTISRIESGRYEPSVFLALAIAEALQVVVETIFYLTPLAPVAPSKW